MRSMARINNTNYKPEARRLVSLVFVFVCLAGFISATEAAAQGASNRRATLGTFDRYIERVIDGQRISYCYGNVFIDRDTLTVASDTAIYYWDRAYHEFYGSVRMTRHEAVLTCKRANYSRITDAGDFFGDVRIIEDDVIGTSRRGESRQQGMILRLMEEALLVTPEYSVRADTITRNRLTGIGHAYGNVRIMQPGARSLVTGNHAVFMANGQVAEVDDEPVLTNREREGPPLTAISGLMRFYRAEDKVVMVDSVRINQGQTRAEADTAVAYGQDHMVLTGEPWVTMGGNSTMLGRQIDFFYDAGQLERIVLVGSARMEDSTPDSLANVYQGLPTMDILEGDTITVFFKDEKVHRSVVLGNARSQYTPVDLDGEVATNNVVGDTIVIGFRNQRVHQVNVNGHMSGTYKFAKVAAMRQLLGQSRRLADLLAGNDSTAIAGGDTLAQTVRDSLLFVQVDSLATLYGLPMPETHSLSAGAMDSLLTVVVDSLASAGLDTTRSTLDFVANAEDVQYAGHSVEFDMVKRNISIRKDGQLKFGTMVLTAQEIDLNTEDRELYAQGEPLIEDSENIAGERMGYDFGNRTGAVTEGVTTFDNYYYVGDEIRRFPDTTLKICGGRMTSCDRAEPHFHFWADKMKMRMGDKVVAKPIVLHVGHVPVFALPFYFKNLTEGRRSGILFPSFGFGWSSREGRYIRDFGYYWATNDYMDFVFEGDYNERQDLGFRISNRYRSRYSFNGGVDYSKRIGLGDSGLREWQLRWNHNQPTLFDDYKFRADVKMASKTLSQNDLSNSGTRDVVSGQLSSNAYISRNFSFMSANLNVKRDEMVNAQDDNPETDNLVYNMTLPQASFNFKQFSLLPPLQGGQDGSFFSNLLRDTYFQHGYKVNANFRGYEVSSENQYSAGGNWSLNLRPPRIGIFNISLNSSAAQNWERNEASGQEWVADSDSTGHYEDFDTIDESTSPSLSFGASANTTLYGLFPVRVGRLKAVRHTLELASGWSTRPGLGSKQRHTSSYTFRMRNRLDIKYLSGDQDSTMTDKKIDGLLDWSLNTSYNPKAEPGDQWGNISSRLTIKPGQARYLKLDVQNSIDPYSLALKSTNFSYALNFRGKADLGAAPAVVEAERNTAIDRLGVDLTAVADSTQTNGNDSWDPNDPNSGQAQDDDYFEGDDDAFDSYYDRPGYGQDADEKDPTEGGRYIPFDVGGRLSYGYTNGSATPTRAQGSLNFSSNITAKWEFKYSASFDLVDGRAIRQQYSLNRDLHCWRLEFNRTISDVNSEFGFRIYLKSIPALKLTRGREQGMSSLAGGLY